MCLSVTVQALELRESCSCPALPATDPRAIFSESVRVLLESTKGQRKAVSGATITSLPRGPVSLPSALLAEAALPPSPDVNQKGNDVVPVASSETVVAAVLPAEEQHQVHSTSWQDVKSSQTPNISKTCPVNEQVREGLGQLV